jgi:hypothetical protein
MPAGEAWCQPNPVRSGNPVIRFFLENDSDVTLEFYNDSGRRINTACLAGSTGVNVYNGPDVTGWANGVYLLKLKAKSRADGRTGETVKKIMLLR